jgi:hypothetical protein
MGIKTQAFSSPASQGPVAPCHHLTPRRVAILGALVLAVSLASCGGGSDPGTTAPGLAGGGTPSSGGQVTTPPSQNPGTPPVVPPVTPPTTPAPTVLAPYEVVVAVNAQMMVQFSGATCADIKSQPLINKTKWQRPANRTDLPEMVFGLVQLWHEQLPSGRIAMGFKTYLDGMADWHVVVINPNDASIEDDAEVDGKLPVVFADKGDGQGPTKLDGWRDSGDRVGGVDPVGVFVRTSNGLTIWTPQTKSDQVWCTDTTGDMYIMPFPGSVFYFMHYQHPTP